MTSAVTSGSISPDGTSDSTRREHIQELEERPNDANATTPTRLQKVFPMAKGHGEESYSKNSEVQAFITRVPSLALDEALETMTLPSNVGPVRLVDLGSSSGPNTIASIDHIVRKLRDRLPNVSEFQAYFNDVPSNDFNNLFQLLSNDHRAKNFYAVGVPGSFYDRLFPQSSVHVFHSAMSLHWLSKIPDAVLDKDSPAYNRGQIWYQHSSKAVAESYQQQALLDLKSFFLARAAELVSGGLLFFVICGRETSEPNEVDFDLVCNLQTDVNTIFSGLIAEGLITEEQADTFNIPTYHRSFEDIREALECCGSMFNVLMMKFHKVNLGEAFGVRDSTALPKKLSGMISAGLNPQVEAHFGKNVAEIIWQRLEKLYETNIGHRPDDILNLCIVGLIRN